MASKRKSQSRIQDVAEAAGVSITTVSRALNGTGPVKAEVRARIEAVARKLSYIPERAAQDLSRRRSYSLGAIIPTLDYSIYARKIDAFRRRSEQLGYNVLIAVSDYNSATEESQCINLLRSGAEGLMLEGGVHNKSLYKLLDSRHVPYVNTSTLDATGTHPSIGFSNKAIAGKATQHLLDLGHKVFGVIAANTGFNDRSRERIQGVRERLAAVGNTLLGQYVIECSFMLAESRRAFRQVMNLNPPATAIVCTNDILAMGAILEAQHMGVSVPREVSILGFDDLDWSPHLLPSLTTLLVPMAEMGQEAATYLCDRLQGKSVRNSIEMDVKFILRESTGPAPK
jgi:LacI family transcriptional regulator